MPLCELYWWDLVFAPLICHVLVVTREVYSHNYGRVGIGKKNCTFYGCRCSNIILSVWNAYFGYIILHGWLARQVLWPSVAWHKVESLFLIVWWQNRLFLGLHSALFSHMAAQAEVSKTIRRHNALGQGFPTLFWRNTRPSILVDCWHDHRSWSKFKSATNGAEHQIYNSALLPGNEFGTPGFASDTPRGADTPGWEPLF